MSIVRRVVPIVRRVVPIVALALALAVSSTLPAYAGPAGSLALASASVRSSDHDKLVAWQQAGGVGKLQAVLTDMQTMSSAGPTQPVCTKLAADADAVAATATLLPASVGGPLNSAMTHLANAGRACASGNTIGFIGEFTAAVPDLQKALAALKAIK